MIRVKRLNNKEFVVNSELILFVEATPDTVITLTNDRKVVIKEDVDVIIQRIAEFKRKIFYFPYGDEERFGSEV
mgnify:CR=1 FL=1